MVLFQSAECVHLCQSCTDALTSAYTFWQRVKQSDESLSVVSLSKPTRDKPHKREHSEEEEIEFIATDEVDIEHYLIANGSNANPLDENDKIVQKTNDTTKRKAKKPKTKETNTLDSASRIGVNIALPYFMIANNTTNADPVVQNDNETLSNDNKKNDTSQSVTHSKPIKTLTASLIVPTSLEQINELAVSSLQTEDDAQSIFKCSHCPKAFAAPYHLMIHMRKSHLCQYCLSTFNKITELYEHVKEAHQSFDCLLCDKEFQSNGNLRQHMRKNHAIFLPAYISLLNLEDISRADIV